MFTERSYQSAALAAIDRGLDAGIQQQLLAMATGTGKTVVFSQLPQALAHKLPGQQLVIAHREELIDQSIAKIREINPTLRIDKEKAQHKADPSQADVIVASVATLGRKNNPRLKAYNWQNFDKYVIDEAHHSPASTYMNILNASGMLTIPGNRLLLGVTATPQRADGKALAQIYKKIVYSYTMRQAIEDGWLVDVKGVRIATDTSLDGVKTVAGDFAQDELANTVNTPKRNQLIVKGWKDHGGNRSTIGFTVDIQHALDLAAMFQHYEVKAEAIWGNDPDRASKLQRHRAGEITVLCNCGVLTEGYDDWQVGCIILARPTKSGVLFTQMVGRATRLEEGTGNLIDHEHNCYVKKDCIVLDVVDSTFKHSLITLPTLMGLNGKLNLQGKSLVKSVQSIEAAQREFSHIDFSTLADITQLKSFIESVNLFTVKFPEEVEANSDLSWMRAPSGGFVLNLPKKNQAGQETGGGQFRITQNLLDTWEIIAIIGDKKFKAERPNIEEAFSAADNLLQDKAAEHLKILRRHEKWHGDPATVGQLNFLRKIYKGKALPDNLDKGTASKLISQFVARK